MNHLLKNTSIAVAILITGVLSIRGATSLYKQFVVTDSAETDQELIPAPAVVSKAERLARASRLVSGMGKQGQVTDIFSAPDGSTGIVIQSGEGKFIGWMVDNIDAVWVGAKFDTKGTNMTQEEMLARGYAKAVNAPSTPESSQAAGTGNKQAGALLQAVDQSAGFIEGTAGPIWTAYIDANCTFCNQLWRNLREPLASGQIRVRWAPVAVLAPSSTSKAATLMQSDNPLRLLAEHGVQGSPIAESTITSLNQNKLDANNAMLRALNPGKAPATPTIVIPMQPGTAPMVVTGIPTNLQELIKAARS